MEYITNYIMIKLKIMNEKVKWKSKLMAESEINSYY